jgi:S-adenosylmethionine decarboxylase
MSDIKNLAPDILRQRLLIEGTFSVDIDKDKIAAYLSGLAEHLELRTYGKPTIHATSGAGKAENEGFDAFVPLIDSGISLYVWSEKRFFATLLFTCKEFSNEDAVSYTREFFQTGETAHLSF